MIRKKINGYSVEIYDTIEELPVVRFHKYNKMLLIDSGIGSDMMAFARHIDRAKRYAMSKEPILAAHELTNLQQCFAFIYDELSPKHLAFCALVKSIDGNEVTDISDDGLQSLLKKFADVPQNEITDLLESVKKKIDRGISLYFPKLSEESSAIKEYYNELQNYALLLVNSIIDGKDRSKEIEEAETSLIMQDKPNTFTGVDSLEIKYDKQFENTCLLIAQHLNVDAKTHTVLEYYNAFDYVKELLKPKQKKNGAK